MQALDYDDVKALNGTTIDQDGRDGATYTGVIKAAYEFSPGYRLFGLVQGNRRRFTEEARNSHGLEGRAGLEFEITHLMQGEISAGYLEQDYEGAGFANTNGVAFRGSLLWNPTRLMTITLAGERRISETSIANSSGHLDTVLSSKLDYEILRNLVASPYVNYTIEDYQEINREDRTVQAGLSLQLLINRHISTGAYYAFTQKDSNDNTFDYDKNVVGGTLKIQF